MNRFRGRRNNVLVVVLIVVVIVVPTRLSLSWMDSAGDITDARMN